MDNNPISLTDPMGLKAGGWTFVGSWSCGFGDVIKGSVTTHLVTAASTSMNSHGGGDGGGPDTWLFDVWKYFMGDGSSFKEKARRAKQAIESGGMMSPMQLHQAGFESQLGGAFDYGAMLVNGTVEAALMEFVGGAILGPGANKIITHVTVYGNRLVGFGVRMRRIWKSFFQFSKASRKAYRQKLISNGINPKTGKELNPVSKAKPVAKVKDIPTTHGTSERNGKGELDVSVYNQELIKKQRGSNHPVVKKALAKGHEIHKKYKVDEVLEDVRIKEYKLQNGRRVDFIDFENKIIYELKPNNPRAIKLGQKQLDAYKKQIEKETGTSGWSTVLDTYD